MVGRTCALVAACVVVSSPIARAQEGAPRSHLDVVLQADDGATVPGKLWVAPPLPTPLPSDVVVKRSAVKKIILAFHQAGASSAEYLPIAPRLVRLGYDVLAIDQRVGGTKFGGRNRAAEAYAKTWARSKAALGVDKAQRKRGAPYLDAWPDLVGALTWAKAQGYREILLWGSSYSAALVIKLAAAHPEVTAVLAFSPGEYLGQGLGGGPHVVRDAAAVYEKFRDSPQVLVVSPETERKRAKEIVTALGTKGVAFYVAGGVHGSSTLVDERCAVAPTVWPFIERFLRASSKPARR